MWIGAPGKTLVNLDRVVEIGMSDYGSIRIWFNYGGEYRIDWVFKDKAERDRVLCQIREVLAGPSGQRVEVGGDDQG